MLLASNVYIQIYFQAEKLQMKSQSPINSNNWRAPCKKTAWLWFSKFWEIHVWSFSDVLGKCSWSVVILYKKLYRSIGNCEYD